MNEDPTDLSSLDPLSDRVSFERAIRSILEGAAAELSRRRAASGPMAALVRARRPLLAAAVVLAIAALATYRWVDIPGESPEGDPVAQAIGVPAALSVWMQSDRIASPGLLLFALEEGRL